MAVLVMFYIQISSFFEFHHLSPDKEGDLAARLAGSHWAVVSPCSWGQRHRDRHAAQAACLGEEPKPKYPDGRLHLVKVDQVVATFNMPPRRLAARKPRSIMLVTFERKSRTSIECEKKFEVKYWVLTVSTELVRFFREVNRSREKAVECFLRCQLDPSPRIF